MPTPTYDLVASNVLSTNATSVTFSSISSSYRDLIIVITARQTSGTGQNQLRFNSDSGGNYANVSMEGTGAVAQSAYASTNAWWYINYNNGDLDSSFTTSIVNIFDYAQSNKQKTGLSRGNSMGSGTSVGANAHRWASNSAINTILIQASGTYAAGSSFYIYGLVS